MVVIFNLFLDVISVVFQEDLVRVGWILAV